MSASSCAKITQALHAIMEEVSHVRKGGENKFHGYKYTGEVDLLEKLRPIMLKHGLLLLPSITSVSEIDQYGNTHIQVSYTLAHKDGEVWPNFLMAAGCGGDKNKTGVGDKGLYKAITGANKYFLLKLFNIATGDDPEEDTDTTHNVGDGYREQQRKLAEGEPYRAAPLANTTPHGYSLTMPLLPTSILSTPPDEDRLMEAVQAISDLATLSGWNELHQFWQNNIGFFEELKESNKMLFDAVKAKIMSKKPKKEG